MSVPCGSKCRYVIHWTAIRLRWTVERYSEVNRAERRWPALRQALSDSGISVFSPVLNQIEIVLPNLNFGNQLGKTQRIPMVDRRLQSARTACLVLHQGLDDVESIQDRAIEPEVDDAVDVGLGISENNGLPGGIPEGDMVSVRVARNRIPDPAGVSLHPT